MKRTLASSPLILHPFAKPACGKVYAQRLLWARQVERRRRLLSRSPKDDSLPPILPWLATVWMIGILALFLSDEKIQNWIAFALATILRAVRGG
ncbi:MAG: hypothetical protein NZ959_00675 [Armatimonadetes bacterium]|nr:hypothetical protein [Armatimonadota bacterium]MDW8121097.1 hypothetical protein [Armatimonadota bacterium]